MERVTADALPRILGQWMVANAPALAAAAVALALLAAAIAVATRLTWRRERRRYRAFLRGAGDGDLEAVLAAQADEMRRLEGAVRDLERRADALGRAALSHIQHVGLVRYSAFAETGSDLSFSLALLDGQRNGVVISSLYGRDDSRTYAKPIQAGRSTYRLSAEEQAAIEQALRAPAADGARRARTG